MTKATADAAFAALNSMDRGILATICYDAHKDIYGVKGHHLLDNTHLQLIEWFLSHFNWNDAEGRWTLASDCSSTPDDYEEDEPEVQQLEMFSHVMEDDHEGWSNYQHGW